MKFYEKYPQLKEKKFLAKMLTKTVFSTMALEDQRVSLSRVRELVWAKLKEQESKESPFFLNQKS